MCLLQQTTIFTKYYQQAKHYADITKLLFLPKETTFLYNTIHQSTLHIFQNYYYLDIKLLCWEGTSTFRSYTRKKVLLESWRNRFVSASYFLMKPFV